MHTLLHTGLTAGQALRGRQRACACLAKPCPMPYTQAMYLAVVNGIQTCGGLGWAIHSSWTPCLTTDLASHKDVPWTVVGCAVLALAALTQGRVSVTQGRMGPMPCCL